MEKKKILVLGLGNLLFRDAGLGMHIIEKLKTVTLPPDVEIMDGGIMAFDIVYSIEGRKKVIAVSAIRADGSPGTIYRFTGRDIEERRSKYVKAPYEAEFLDYYRTARLMGSAPEELVLFGIQPDDTGDKDMKLKVALSPILENKVPEIIDLVMKEIT